MYRLVLLLLLFLVVPDTYIYYVHVLHKTRNIRLRIAYWLPTLLLATDRKSVV